MARWSGSSLFNVFFIVFLLFFSPFPMIDANGKNLEAKVLEALGDKESIEATLVPFVDFDWDTVKIFRYARYVSEGGMRCVYGFEFQSSSGEMIKQVILPLRFSGFRYVFGSVRGYESPYLEQSGGGASDSSLVLKREQKFRIRHTAGICRDGGKNLEFIINM